MNKPQTIIDKGFHDQEYARIVANIKRVLEKWGLDATFRDEYEQDPDRALAGTGLDVDPEAVRLLLDGDASKQMTCALKEGELVWADLPDGYRFY